MGRFRTYAEVGGSDRSGLADQLAALRARVDRRLGAVGRAVAVTSGKGGVGKSFVTSALAAELSRAGRRVGLLDADFQGPTGARMSGLQPRPLTASGDSVEPARSATGVAVMSMGLLLPDGAPLSWRGPAADSFLWSGPEERRALREFLSDVEWGELDWLLIDLPPGTQRTLDLVELVPQLTGLIGLTIPSEAARSSARRALELAAQRGVPLLGVVENMAGYACAECGAVRPLFAGRAGEALAEAHAVPLLGRIPFDPAAAELADLGSMDSLLEETAAGRAVRAVAAALAERTGTTPPGGASRRRGGEGRTRAGEAEAPEERGR